MSIAKLPQKVINGFSRHIWRGLVIGTAILVWPRIAWQASLVSCGTNCTVIDFLNIPVKIFNWLVGMSALVLLLVIVWAGIRMMLYHTAESPESELQAAKLTLRQGLFGFAIVLMAYLIINTLAFTILGLNPGGQVARTLQDFGFVR